MTEREEDKEERDKDKMAKRYAKVRENCEGYKTR